MNRKRQTTSIDRWLQKKNPAESVLTESIRDENETETERQENPAPKALEDSAGKYFL